MKTTPISKGIATGSNSLDSRITRMIRSVGSEAEFNYTIHVSEELQFIFFSNPICACSTLKASLNLATASALGIDLFLERAEDIHDRRKNILLDPQTIGYDRFLTMLDSPAVLKFAFVRDPLSRFCSAFYKKLCFENSFTRKIRRHLDISPEVPLQSFLTLDSFAKAVRHDSILRDIDEHWRLQRAQIFFDHVTDIQIGRVERLAEDFQTLLGPVFDKKKLPIFSVESLNPHNSSRPRQRDVEITTDLRNNIKISYAQDYTLIKFLDSQAHSI